MRRGESCAKNEQKKRVIRGIATMGGVWSKWGVLGGQKGCLLRHYCGNITSVRFW